MLTKPDAIIGHNSGRMSEAEYDRQRALIAPTKQQAGIRWEQELARLFHRSGWTQKELAKREPFGPTRISQLIMFGQFLTFFENSNEVGILRNVSSKRFLVYWGKTSNGKNSGEIYRRERFREALRLIKEESHTWGRWPRKPRLPPDTSFKLIKKCGDGKWRSAKQIAARTGLEEDQAAHLVTHSLNSSHRDKCTVETKKVGAETHYRIFKKDKTVSVDELTEKLTPIIQALEAEGKKSAVTTVPAEVRMLAAKLKRILDEWAE